MVLDLTKTVSREHKRTQRRARPNGQRVFQGSDTMELLIPMKRNETLDPNTLRLGFDIVSNSTSATTEVFQDYAASSVIKDITFNTNSGSVLIGEQMRDYHGYARKELEIMTTDEYASSYGSMEGAKASAEAGVGGQTSREYSHRLLTGITTAMDLLPLGRQGGLKIDIQLESALNVVITDGTSADYTMSNVFVYYDIVELRGEQEKALSAKLDAGLVIHYEQFVSRNTNIDASVSSITVNFGNINSPVKRIDLFQVITADHNGQAEDFWGFERNDLTSYKMLLGNEPLVNYDIQVSATRKSEYMYQFLRSRHQLDNHTFGNSNWNPNSDSSFVIGQLVERSSMEADKISSRRLGSQNNLDIELNYAGSGAAARLYVYVLVDKEVQIKGENFVNKHNPLDLQ